MTPVTLSSLLLGYTGITMAEFKTKLIDFVKQTALENDKVSIRCREMYFVIHEGANAIMNDVWNNSDHVLIPSGQLAVRVNNINISGGDQGDLYAVVIFSSYYSSKGIQKMTTIEGSKFTSLIS